MITKKIICDCCKREASVIGQNVKFWGRIKIEMDNEVATLYSPQSNIYKYFWKTFDFCPACYVKFGDILADVLKDE